MVFPDFYKMQFNVDSYANDRTFEFKEEVIIYDLSGLNTGEILTEGGEYILDEKEEFIITETSGPFRLYKDPGYIHQVPCQSKCDGLTDLGRTESW